MPDKYYRYCTKCEGKIVLHAFSDGDCSLCEKNIQTSHTPCDKVCRECSIEKNLCMSCGENLFTTEYGKMTKEYLKEAVEYVFRENKPKPQERFIKLVSYCKGIDGAKQFNSGIGWDLCDHPDCLNCRNFESAIKEAFSEWKPEIWFSEKRSDIEYYFEIKPKEIVEYFPGVEKIPSNIRSVIRTEELTGDEIISRYGHLLSESQIKQIKDRK